MNTAIFVLTLCAALGSGLMAGVFFAFSTFVMQALARLQPAQGIEAMQEINRTVLNPWFLGVFMGTAVLSLVLGGMILEHWGQPGAVYVVAGCLLYFVGTFAVTAAFNVPMNNALERVEAGSEEGARLWDDYLKRWTRWNHVRTVAALLGAAALTLALWPGLPGG